MSAFLLLAGLALVCAALSVSARPGRSSSTTPERSAEKSMTQYYGDSNKCKLELFPWPASVTCESSGDASPSSPHGMISLDKEEFRIKFAEDSKAQDFEILLDAIKRYQDVIFEQPFTYNRGIINPEFTFADDAPHRRLGLEGEKAHGNGGNGNGDYNDSYKGSAQLRSLVISVEQDVTSRMKILDDDESYILHVSIHNDHATLQCVSAWGCMYGLETFSQLVTRACPKKASSFAAIRLNQPGAHSVTIKDTPRFVWRGFLLDTCNHFLQLGTIKKLIDSMAASKYNVLHWHITDSYSFSYQSETFPDLTAAGAWPKMTCASDSGDQCVYAYSPQQIQQVVKYANERGIRSVVEVDVPGHAYAWGLSEKYKSVTTDCPNYVDELGHVDDIPLDPSQDLTYEVVRDMVGVHASDDHWVSSSDKEVQGVFSELAEVFSDQYMHIGGDEVKFGCWNESASIKQYMQAQGMASGDFKSLENEFFTRMGKFVGQKLGKKLLAWEEVFFTDSGGNTGAHGAWVGSDALSAEECIVEVWTGPDFVAAANDNGYDALLAYGWYLDRQNPIDDETTWYFMDTWAQMYLVDPDGVGTETAQHSTSLQAKRVGQKRGRNLGGEVSMWTENVDDANMDTQVWPRAAAAAERMWSPRETRDVAAAATRLSLWRCRLVERYGVRAGPVWSDMCSAVAGLKP